MSDLSITAASVAVVDAQTDTATAGAAITAGQTIYLDLTTNKMKLCDADASAAAANLRGIALHAAADGQPIRFCTEGDMNLGATLTVGEIYVTSGNAGGIAPRADLTTGWYTKIVGIAKTTAILTVINRGPTTLVAKAA